MFQIIRGVLLIHLTWHGFQVFILVIFIFVVENICLGPEAYLNSFSLILSSTNWLPRFRFACSSPSPRVSMNTSTETPSTSRNFIVVIIFPNRIGTFFITPLQETYSPLATLMLLLVQLGVMPRFVVRLVAITFHTSPLFNNAPLFNQLACIRQIPRILFLITVLVVATFPDFTTIYGAIKWRRTCRASVISPLQIILIDSAYGALENLVLRHIYQHVP